MLPGATVRHSPPAPRSIVGSAVTKNYCVTNDGYTTYACNGEAKVKVHLDAPLDCQLPDPPSRRNMAPARQLSFQRLSFRRKKAKKAKAEAASAAPPAGAPDISGLDDDAAWNAMEQAEAAAGTLHHRRV